MSSLQHFPAPCQLDCHPDEAPELPESAYHEQPVEVLPGLAAWINHVAGQIRAKGSPAADWLACRVDQLAEQARSLRADTPDQFDAREELHGGWRDHNLYMEGFSNGERSAMLFPDRD